MPALLVQHKDQLQTVKFRPALRTPTCRNTPQHMTPEHPANACKPSFGFPLSNTPTPTLTHTPIPTHTHRGEPALLIQQVQEAHPTLHKVQHFLVVHKLYIAPVNALTHVLSLRASKEDASACHAQR
jgi:hypothetical protein